MPATARTFQAQKAPVGLYIPRTSAATLPATTTTTYFAVTGIVQLEGLIGVVTTAIQAQATVTKWRHTPTGGSVGDISGTVDINGWAVGDLYVVQGPTAAGALSQAPTRGQLAAGGATGFTLGIGGGGGIILPSGNLGFNTAATSTGAFLWYAWYTPMTPGAKLIPA